MHPWHPLLALRRAAGSRQGALAEAITQTFALTGQDDDQAAGLPQDARAERSHAPTAQRIEPDLEALCREGPWAPKAEHWHAAARQLAAVTALDIDVIPFWSLPRRLQHARPATLALFVRGSSDLLSAPACAIVGSRRAHTTAVQWASHQAQVAARRGKLVVSGGARGVDAAAHRGALQCGAPTLAYLGVAVDRSYPSEHRSLFADIIENGGAIVSEHPPTSVTFPSDHAKRNRFIAAHADELLVAEAAEGSGALGTARYARRSDTVVWVSPPGVGSQRTGIEDLLRTGRARVLEGLLPDGTP